MKQVILYEAKDGSRFNHLNYAKQYEEYIRTKNNENYELVVLDEKCTTCKFFMHTPFDSFYCFLNSRLAKQSEITDRPDGASRPSFCTIKSIRIYKEKQNEPV